MRDIARLLLLVVVAATLPTCASGQKSGTVDPKAEAVLVSFSKPAYPLLARQANIWGEVIVAVTVRPDGTSEAVVVSGHPMLKQAALDSATQSHFECRSCSVPVTYSLVYSFKQTEEGNCCDALSVPAKVEQELQATDRQGTSQTRVTISAEHGCLCDPSFVTTKRKARSWRCLYLWQCSTKQ
jgi:TonB family protein